MKALSPNSNSYQMLILEKNHNLPLLPSMASILFDLPSSRVMNSQNVHRSRFYALISDHPKITTNIFLFYNLRLEETATVLKSNPIQNLNLLGLKQEVRIRCSDVVGLAHWKFTCWGSQGVAWSGSPTTMNVSSKWVGEPAKE